ncbi:MAG: aquaporin family protein [Citromicrobium sp.]|nr:aquaporin family protein [Citromicrobium sp.]
MSDPAPPAAHSLSRRLAAEGVGSFFLFLGVLGSGVMAEGLAGGNMAVALLANTIATGAILYVLIAMLAPISGAHFNPAVTLAFWLRGEIAARPAILYVLVQIGIGILGAFAAHLMFDLPIVQFSEKPRSGIGQWAGEAIATFGLVMTILVTLKRLPGSVPASVALYITAASWFTPSTSFANPAITIVRSLSDTFAGIAPEHVPGFIAAQLVGTLLAVALGGWLAGDEAG